MLCQRVYSVKPWICLNWIIRKFSEWQLLCNSELASIYLCQSLLSKFTTIITIVAHRRRRYLYQRNGFQYNFPFKNMVHQRNIVKQNNIIFQCQLLRMIWMDSHPVLHDTFTSILALPPKSWSKVWLDYLINITKRTWGFCASQQIATNVSHPSCWCAMHGTLARRHIAIDSQNVSKKTMCKHRQIF